MAALAASVLAIALLAGCTTSGDTLPNKYGQGVTQNYVSGDGTYKEFSPADRKPAVAFSGKTDSGVTVSNAQFTGKPLVLNFWYAGCPPCRKEAPELKKLSATYAGKARFLGVNTYNQAATSLAFSRQFGITYPSIIDTNSASVQYAFSASVPANAVPTTLVLDKQGRVAARVTGFLEDPSILAAMIDRVLAEKS